MNQETTMTNKTRTKIIKRYQNRKLYDTQQSCYDTLDSQIANKHEAFRLRSPIASALVRAAAKCEKYHSNSQ